MVQLLENWREIVTERSVCMCVCVQKEEELRIMSHSLLKRILIRYALIQRCRLLRMLKSTLLLIFFLRKRKWMNGKAQAAQVVWMRLF